MRLDRANVLAVAALIGLGGALLAGCSSADAPNVAGATTCEATGDAFVAAAESEGALTLIAVPDTWANYGKLRADFESQYAITTSVLDPEMKSAEELELLRTATPETTLPDVIDIGAPYVEQAKAEGLVAAYRSQTWGQVPEALKDPEGYWTSAYYGLMAIGATGPMVADLPDSWQGLDEAKYAGQVTINGDPRESSSALAAVFAAALANGGSLDDVGPGIDYFARLASDGVLVGYDNTEELLMAGDIPIAIDWTYAFSTAEERMAGLDLAYTVPADGVYGSFYAQAVVANAPHPCAARLWMDYLTSDQAQQTLLQAGAVPSRVTALEAEGLVEPRIVQMLPSGLDSLGFATPEQLEIARDLVAERWGTDVLGEAAAS